MVNQIMKQNKNTSVVLRVASAALAAVFLFLSLSLPSSAIDAIVPPEIPYATTTSTDSVLAYTSLVSGPPTSPLTVYTPQTEVALFTFCITYGGKICAVIAGESSANASMNKYRISTSSFTGGHVLSNDHLDNDTGLYYGIEQTWSAAESTSELLVPYYDTLADGLSAVQSVISGGGSGDLNPPGHFAGRLAPGYVGYFDVSNLTDVSVVLGTSLYTGAKYSGFHTNQAIGTSSSLPSGQFSLPISGTHSINWVGSSQKNLIGQYTGFAYRYTVTSSGGTTYLVVVNPFTGPAATNTAWEASAANRNNYITVLIDQCRSYKVFSLTESLSISDTGWTEESTSNGDSSSGHYDEDSGSWVGQNDVTGESQNFNDLPIGGGNDPYVGNVFDSIAEFLENIAEQIKQFFTGAIGAVTTLVSAGSAFINQLIGLYSWLPAPVYAVLSSALILVITIGVIKVFI